MPYRKWTINELGVLTAENSDSFKRMVIGYLNLMRTNGAFEDKVFDEYTMGDGNGYMLSNDRNRWLPGRQSGRNTPRFIAEHIGNGRSSLSSIHLLLISMWTGLLPAVTKCW